MKQDCCGGVRVERRVGQRRAFEEGGADKCSGAVVFYRIEPDDLTNTNKRTSNESSEKDERM